MSGEGLLKDAFDYVTPPEAQPGLRAAVTAEQAIGDLPPIDARSAAPVRRAAAWRTPLRPACALRPAAESVGVRMADADLARIRGA